MFMKHAHAAYTHRMDMQPEKQYGDMDGGWTYSIGMHSRQPKRNMNDGQATWICSVDK
jgi:hypothetical protein